MRHPALKTTSDSNAFTDLLFNALLGFVFMFAIAFMLISNPIKQGTIDSHAEMLVTIRSVSYTHLTLPTICSV